MKTAQWYFGKLDASEFHGLLVFDGGRPLSGWQEFTNGSYEIGDVVVHLNDAHEWSRQKIADWVDSTVYAAGKEVEEVTEVKEEEYATV